LHKENLPLSFGKKKVEQRKPIKKTCKYLQHLAGPGWVGRCETILNQRKKTTNFLLEKESWKKENRYKRPVNTLNTLAGTSYLP